MSASVRISREVKESTASLLVSGMLCALCVKRQSLVIVQMKATEQDFPMVLSVMVYMVVLAFESVDETRKV